MRQLDGLMDSLMKGMLSLIVIWGITACGSDDDGPSNTNISYTGTTTAAAISNNNAPAISNDSISTARTGGGGLTGLAAEGESVSSSMVHGIIARSVREVASGSDAVSAVVAGAQVSDAIQGPCGGIATFTGAIDELSNSFDLAIDYQNFCFEGVVLAGSVEASGISDGWMIDVSIISSQLVIKINGTDTTYMYRNYSSSVSSDFYDVTFSVSGTFYHPDYGYVIVSTTTPFTVLYGDLYPSSGVMEIMEDNATPDTAILTALNPNQYQLDIDYHDTGPGIDRTVTRDWGDVSPIF